MQGKERSLYEKRTFFFIISKPHKQKKKVASNQICKKNKGLPKIVEPIFIEIKNRTTVLIASVLSVRIFFCGP